MTPAETPTDTPPARPAHRTQQSHQYYIVDHEDTTIAHVHVSPRHGGWFVTNVWCHHSHRRTGLITQLMEAVLAQYSHEPLYLNVWAYTDQPRPDEELVDYYGRFGFALVPGAAGHMHRPPGPHTPRQEATPSVT